MKTKLHLTLLAALCTMAALFTTSCSDDEPDRPTTEEEAAQMLVGQWKAIKVKKTNGNTSDIDNWYWEFTADGRYFEPNDPTIFAVNLDGETEFLITQMTSNSFHVQYSAREWVGGALGYKYIWEDGPTVMRVKDPVIPTDTIPSPYK